MTTAVGSIRFDLRIDGSRLSSEAVATIQRHLRPVLAQVQHDLRGVQDAYKDTGRSAQRSALTQIAANRRVLESLRDIRREQERIRALGGLGGGGPGGGFRQTINNYYNTTTNTTNNNGGGGSGGFGGRHGGGGRGHFLTSPVGVNAIALGVASFPAAATAATNLAGAIVQLSQASLLLPSIFGSVAASVGTAVIGFKGMGDAVKALNEAAASGDPKDLEKATEALKDMAPAAVEVATAVSKLTQGPLKDLQKTVQQKMFAGVAGEIEGLAGKALPVLDRGLGGIGDAWNGTLKTITGSLGADKNLSLIDRFLGNTAEGQKRANAAIDPLIHAFATLASTGGEFLPRLGDALADVARRFDAFISKAGASGQLWKWIDEGLNGLRALGNSVLNIGKTLTGLTKAAGGDGGFLGWLERATGQMSAFVNSTAGQETLKNFFKEGRAQLEQWAPILENLVTILGSVYEGAKQWSAVLLPALQAVTDVLAGMPDLVQSAVVGFLAFKTLGGIMGAAGTRSGAAFVGGFSGALKSFGWAAVGAVIGDQLLDPVLKAFDDKLGSKTSETGPPGSGQWFFNLVKDPQGTIRKTLGLDLPWLPGSDKAAAPPTPAAPGQLGDTAQSFNGLAGGAAIAKANVDLLGDAIAGLPNGYVTVNDEQTGQATQRIINLGSQIQKLPSGVVSVDADTKPAYDKINALVGDAANASLTIPVNIASLPTIGPNWGNADGGVLPGFSPGVDNMLWPMSGGEGVVIPEAMRALGSGWLYGINSAFRKGLSRRGYADGGTIPHLGTGLPPGPAPGFPVTTPGPQNPIPVYIVNGPGGGTSPSSSPFGQSSPFAQALTDGVTRGAQDVAGTVLDDVTRGFQATFKGPVGPNTPRITKPDDADSLLGTIATAAGFTVADFSRRGGGASAQNLMRRDGPAFNASGQVFSDTSALLDRTLASLESANQARHKQLMDVMTQVRDQLTERLLLPTMKTAVTEGIGAVGDATNAAIGQAMGQAAGPPIATAVGSAVRSNSAGGPGGLAAGAIAAVPGLGGQLAHMAVGGGVFGGVAGRDSVPSLLMPGEFVFNTADVARMGGIAGTERFRQALARTGGLRGYATGGGVSANETVGAEFFGVSEIPIISTIVNLLVRVLLAVLGVNIEARDTLNEMTDEFRGFRGDAFKAFDATGRLMNDTSALMDRSSSSEETAAQERIRILKIVMEALIKYIIEKVIVPLAKAVVNSLLNFAGSAASTGIQAGLGTASFGMGGQAAGALLGNLASSLITGVGGAGVDVVADVLASTAVQLSSVMVDMIGDGLLSYFPQLMANAFGGGQVEKAIVGPLTGMLTDPALGLFGQLFGGLQGLGGGLQGLAGGLFAPLLALLGAGAVFDDGGVARGVGLMPKAIHADEWMLAPQHTADFRRTTELAHQLANGGGGSKSVEVHATINMYGSQATPEAVGDYLLELIGG